MFPERDDFIEVVNESHPCYGLIGRVVDLLPGNQLLADIFGKSVPLDLEEVHLKAQYGSRAYNNIDSKSEDWHLDNLDKTGYYGLIDLALEIRDFDWAKDLYNRMQAAPGKL